MALEEYARKRSFDNSPEPKPVVPASSANRIFCVQRHLARRLHYDLRIEIGGTLKSWAVPQGPSLDPTIKRLAVHVEDHPLEYATFEGNIPKGNYGAGSMMLWDYGWWEPAPDKPIDEMLERGDFKFVLHGEKLRGNFVLAHMKSAAGKGNEWLLIKKKDADAVPGWDIEEFRHSVKTGRTQEEIAADHPPRREVNFSLEPDKPAGARAAPMLGAITPMLATLTEEVPTDPGWIYEVKWDGVRAVCAVDNGNVILRGRKGTEITRQYPELSVLPHHVAAQTAVLDGEVAALDEKGRPSFNRIQPRIMASDANAIAQLARTRPVIFFAFDLLYWNGQDLRGAPLHARRALLERIVRPGQAIQVSPAFQDDPQQLLQAVREQGLEGIVAKWRESPYEGVRSRNWLKIKATRQTELVICGYTIGEREHFGSLLLGIWSQGQFVFAGNVGTGFDQKLLKQLRDKLDELRPARCPFAAAPVLPQPIVWVRPELVCTITYLEWTPDGRLRAPVFAGLRSDVDPSECSRDEASQEAAAASAPLFPPSQTEAFLTVDGHQFQVKNLNKVFYPADGVTKRHVIEYYDAVADLLIPHWKDRPLSLRRYPDGIAKEGFFQKNSADSKFPEWLRQQIILAEDRKMRLQVIGDGRAALLYLANLGCIDQNPWMSRVDSLDNPDFMLLDLDPYECGFDRIIDAALVVRQLLDDVGLRGCPKTTGGDGMHIYVPLDAVYSYDQARSFAEILARLAMRRRPDLFTMPRSLGKREKGRVYFDYMQIARGKTISAPYVLRAYPGAPVATPLDWSEVRHGLDPKQFHIKNVLSRFRRSGDLFAPVLEWKQSLEPAVEQIERVAQT